MPSFGSPSGNVLYLIVCGAPLARDAASLVKEKQSDGHDVCVVATPSGLEWIDADELEDMTGHPLRSQFRGPSEPEFVPRGDAVLVAPATFNTINKWALGINDTLALGLLNEALGRDVPVDVIPNVNDALAGHPAYGRSLEVLKRCGVRFLTA